MRLIRIIHKLIYFAFFSCATLLQAQSLKDTIPYDSLIHKGICFLAETQEKELSEMVRDAIKCLSEKEAMVFCMKYLNEMSIAEISKALEIIQNDMEYNNLLK